MRGGAQATPAENFGTSPPPRSGALRLGTIASAIQLPLGTFLAVGAADCDVFFLAGFADSGRDAHSLNAPNEIWAHGLYLRHSTNHCVAALTTNAGPSRGARKTL